MAAIELLVFSGAALGSTLLGVHSRSLLPEDGRMYQFRSENGTMYALGSDPNISFEPIGIRVQTIALTCRNSQAGGNGQVFYRRADQDFSEDRALSYPTQQQPYTQTMWLPDAPVLEAIRFDLTDIPGDEVTCSSLELNQRVTYRFSGERSLLYGVIGLIGIAAVFRNTRPMVRARQFLKEVPFGRWDAQLQDFASEVGLVARRNMALLVALLGVGIAVYGFELFNLNITIDEEYYAFASPSLWWVSVGRWGLHLLHRLLLPVTVMPFVPLATGLAFQIVSAVLLMRAWEVSNRIQRFVGGAVFLAFPSTAFAYQFSILGYGIGIGFFLVSLSVLLYARGTGLRRFLAVIPATAAIAIYQSFILALGCAFLVHVMVLWLRREPGLLRHLGNIGLILVAAGFVYLGLNRIFLAYYHLHQEYYVVQMFAPDVLLREPGRVLHAVWDTIRKVYGGDKSIYSLPMGAFGILLVVSLGGLLARSLRSGGVGGLAPAAVMAVAILALPFATGLLMGGQYEMRILVGLPISIAGVIVLGMGGGPAAYRILLGTLALLVVYQCAQVANHLFASSYLALEADRALGAQLIARIEEVRATAPHGSGAEYLEVVGYVDRPSTELAPQVSTFGASFFEWDQGNAARVLGFMKTLGFEGLDPVPSVGRRVELVVAATKMPEWPAAGSVQLIGDVVIAKFGPYSDTQKSQLCASAQDRARLSANGFCK